MIKLKDNISILLITINIIFLLYFASQLLIFTNEFALNNIGFFIFTKREIYRFLVLYKQTIIPGLLSSLLYIIYV